MASQATAMPIRVARLGSGGQRTGDGDACCPPVANETPSPAGPRLIRPYPRGRKNFLRGISGWTHKVIALACRRPSRRTRSSWRRRRCRCRCVLPVWATVGIAPVTSIRVARLSQTKRHRQQAWAAPPLSARAKKLFAWNLRLNAQSYCARE